jgi:hypothetical protein
MLTDLPAPMIKSEHRTLLDRLEHLPEWPVCLVFWVILGVIALMAARGVTTPARSFGWERRSFHCAIILALALAALLADMFIELVQGMKWLLSQA